MGVVGLAAGVAAGNLASSGVRNWYGHKAALSDAFIAELRVGDAEEQRVRAEDWLAAGRQDYFDRLLSHSVLAYEQVFHAQGVSEWIAGQLDPAVNAHLDEVWERPVLLVGPLLWSAEIDKALESASLDVDSLSEGLAHWRREQGVCRCKPRQRYNENAHRAGHVSTTHFNSYVKRFVGTDYLGRLDMGGLVQSVRASTPVQHHTDAPGSDGQSASASLRAELRAATVGAFMDGWRNAGKK